MPTVTVEAEVEVDLDEFGDDDLIDELEGRGYVVHKSDFAAGSSAISVYEALKLNRPGALDLAKDFIAGAAGKVAI